jgi:Putative prokaryotic signal transducing protein
VLGIAILARLMGSLVSPEDGNEDTYVRQPATSHEDPKPDMDEFVTVATYDKSIDAHIALGRLSVEGIEAQLFDEQMVQMDWLYSIALGGIKLRVARSDAQAARKVLETDYSAVLDQADESESEK